MPLWRDEWRGAAVDAGEAMARGAEGDPFHRVQNAVAVRADQGEVVGGLDQPPLQLSAPSGPSSALSRGIDDHTARAGMGELAHHLDGSLSRHRQEDGVRRLPARPLPTWSRAIPFDAVQLRAERPRSGPKAEDLGLADRLGEVAPADEGQVPGREQALQIPAGGAPRVPKVKQDSARSARMLALTAEGDSDGNGGRLARGREPLPERLHSM